MLPTEAPEGWEDNVTRTVFLGLLEWANDDATIFVTANVVMRDDGVAVIADLHCGARMYGDDARMDGITSRALQSIPLASLLERWHVSVDIQRARFQALTELHDAQSTDPNLRPLLAKLGPPLTPTQEAALQRLRGLAGPSPTRGPGRPGRAPNFLREVAEAYLRDPGVGVLDRLAQEFDRKRSTMQAAVAAARREGWLTPARTQGARGAQPGPLLLAARRVAPGDDPSPRPTDEEQS